jgi:methyl-accepting chemotaxis protein/methyl-accepting chemotaxis protein-1 (serine sensor receptor)
MTLQKKMYVTSGVMLSVAAGMGVVPMLVAPGDQGMATVRLVDGLLFLVAIVAGVAKWWIVRESLGVLKHQVEEISQGAEQMTTAARQVSSSSQSLAQGASEQAASLEETSASSEEINSMARKNADNSRSTANLLERSTEKVGQANLYLQDMVISMDQITESSGKISKIIKVIDEIAFQTNILALNAAVEAARAGEAGMGFAVVADEVRNLAQRSAQAAKDTAELIEDSIARSSEGKMKVDQVVAAIRAVTEDSTRVKVMVDEVHLGSEEQSRGIEQIGRAISQMETVTQSIAANAEESAAAAEELNAQSESLQELAGRMARVLGQGESRARNRVAARRSLGPLASRALPGLTKSAPFVSKLTKPVGHHVGFGKKSAVVDEFPMEGSFQSF